MTRVFAACRMRAFAALVSRQLGVQVKLRGREICVRYGKPPTIFLPAMENAGEDDLKPIYGFCLHEAGHLAFTNVKIARKAPNYLVKSLHNAIEDELVERRLERKSPGARAMLEEAYAAATKMMPEGRPLVDPKSWLGPDRRDEVKRLMAKIGLDAVDVSLAGEVAKRLEIERVAKLWIVEKRRYALPLHDWPEHPWRETFQQETEPRAKSTKETYAQALRIIEKLGIKPVLPDDRRPVEVAEAAKAAKKAACEARKALREAKKARKAELDRLREAGSGKRAQKAFEEAAARHARIIEPLAVKAKETDKAAQEAKENADKAAKEIRSHDEKVDSAIDKELLRRLIERQFEQYRKRGLDEELTEVVSTGFIAENADPELAAARQYCVHDRSHDRVDRVQGTPKAAAELRKALDKQAATIRETAERLRRLYSPELTRLKANAEKGRLDPRKAYKLGLALRGAPTDLGRVWRDIEVRKDPRVTVSLLVDCSGSMTCEAASGEARIDLARQAAACLSAVMASLNISHEVIGHTTLSSKTGEMIKSGEIVPGDLEHFSRLVPFRGYVFKPFEEKTPTTAVFADFAMEDNLDGEAVLWAVQRLAARREKTKVCIVISDGSPAASLSNIAELDRHLYSVCKQVEAREKEGLFLFGLGIGEERVRTFYKNAEVLTAVEDLPKAVLGIVERVLAGLKRR